MQISDEMLEGAASAMYSHGDKGVWKNLEEHRKLFWRSYALAALEAALSAAEPPVAMKTPFEIASKHIPEARVSLLSRAIRQGLNDYGWKNFGTLPEVLMGYIVQAEKYEAAAHPQKPRDCGHDGGNLSERRDNIGSAYTRTALTAQVQDVAEETLRKACEAFAEASAIYPDGEAKTPVIDWFDLNAQDAVDFGILKEPSWHGHSDIRGMQMEQYVAAVVKEPMRAALRAVIAAAPAKQEGNP